MAATRDPLLTVAKIVLAFVMGVSAFAAFFVLLGAFAVPLFQGDIAAEFVAEGKGPMPAGFPWGLSALLAGIAALLGLLIYFLLLLWRIVGTVGEGDPFVPENAARLSRMGWVAVAGNVLALVVSGIAGWIARIAVDLGEDVHLDIDFGGVGLLLILVLFILARVFRQGAAMREDLEGTV